MNNNLKELLYRLESENSLTTEEYEKLISDRNKELQELAAKLARKARARVYGDVVFARGLVEISNVCVNDCLYCGIRLSNDQVQRYTLNREEIIACCEQGCSLGFRTFVFQGGESGAHTVGEICDIVKEIKQRFPDCAVTLSLGEYPYEAYKEMREAGVDRYLLRHETADPDHYAKLHPAEMSFENRMRCLHDLKKLGFQAGCGFMVGSPGQTSATLAKDLKFIEEFKPEMCGIGPFIPSKGTPFGECPAGDLDLTLYLLSLIRLIRPDLLLPATTALGTLAPGGREAGIRAGANVVMPNLSPVSEREKYSLYDNKLSTGAESAENLNELKKNISEAGCELVFVRGDHKSL